MPSRPVLIGRGLVPTPYITDQHEQIDEIPFDGARVHMQFPDHKPTPRTGDGIRGQTRTEHASSTKTWNTPTRVAG